MQDIIHVVDESGSGRVKCMDFVAWWNETHGQVMVKHKKYFCCGEEERVRGKLRADGLHRQREDIEKIRQLRFQTVQEEAARGAKLHSSSSTSMEAAAERPTFPPLPPLPPLPLVPPLPPVPPDLDGGKISRTGFEMSPLIQEMRESGSAKTHKTHRLPRSHIHTRNPDGEIVVKRRSHFQACLPFCFVLLVSITCVLMIAAVTATFDHEKTMRWLSIAGGACLLKWFITDPIYVFSFGPMMVMNRRGWKTGEWYRDTQVVDLCKMATQEMEKKRFGKAAMLLQEALDMDPHNQRLRADERRVEREAAKCQVMQQVRIDGEEALAGGDSMKAIQMFEAALAMTPDDVELQQQEEKAQQQLELLRVAERTSRAELAREKGMQALNKRRFHKAETNFKLAASLNSKLHPNDKALRQELNKAIDKARTGQKAEQLRLQGETLMKVHHYAKAETVLRQAMELDPILAETAQGMVEQANVLARIQKLKADGEVAMEEGDSHLAVAKFKEALALDPLVQSKNYTDMQEEIEVDIDLIAISLSGHSNDDDAEDNTHATAGDSNAPAPVELSFGDVVNEKPPKAMEEAICNEVAQHLREADAHLKLNDWKAAARSLQSVLRRHAVAPAAMAITALQCALKRKAKSAATSAHHGEAVAYAVHAAELGVRDDELEALRLVSHQRADVSSLVALAAHEHAAGDHDAALDTLQQASAVSAKLAQLSKHDCDLAHAEIAVAETQSNRAAEKKLHVDALVAKGKVLLHELNFAEAEASFASALAMDSQCTKATAWAKKATVQHRRWNEADSLLDQAETIPIDEALLLVGQALTLCPEHPRGKEMQQSYIAAAKSRQQHCPQGADEIDAAAKAVVENIWRSYGLVRNMSSL